MSDVGASEFITTATGETMTDAFQTAVEDARRQYGDGGYTGTIAEKELVECVIVTSDVLEDDVARAVARRLLRDDDPRVSDKWGPVGAIKLRDGHWEQANGLHRWLFVGVASS